MDAKEKAEEIIRKYYTWGIRKEGQTLSWLESKQCALIAVEEILNDTNASSPFELERLNFWNEVRTELLT